MAIALAEKLPAEIQEVIEFSGEVIPRVATFSVSFEAVRAIVESSPSPKRPRRHAPIHGIAPDESVLRDRIEQISPTNQELRDLAARFPAPEEWINDDDQPF
jgi:hypothetical protein